MSADSRARRAGRFANAVRLLVGLGFVVAAFGNWILFLPDADELLTNILELTSWDWYRDAFEAIVMGAPRLWVGVLGVYELTAGLLILSKGPAVRIGLVMTAVFLLGIVPLIGWYSATNLVTVLAPLALLTRRYDRTVVDVVLRRDGEDPSQTGPGGR